MKAKIALLFCVLPIIGAEPEGYKYWSAADLKSSAKTLAAKLDAQKFASDRLAEFGNHYALLAHREGSGQPELHDSEVDVFFATSGSATLVVGGTLRGGKTTAPGEIRGGTIEGGTRQKISAGDVVHIPVKTPHQLLLEPGAQFTYFVVKVKE
jgi:mannose-6-phosphate isomerase-like protein (cupin superfamily)